MTNRLDHEATYRKHLQHLLAQHAEEEAYELAVGGQFKVIGKLQKDLLTWAGFLPEHALLDVGCGAGRLAMALQGFHQGSYLGLDILPELLEFARRKLPDARYQFLQAKQYEVHAEPASQDFACFFSVCTHILHEESFRYLQSTEAALKPGGRLLFSFLELQEPRHWKFFEGALQNLGSDHHLDVFIERPAIRTWAEHLGLSILDIRAGSEPFIPREDGSIGHFGQSVALLEKLRTAEAPLGASSIPQPASVVLD